MKYLGVLLGVLTMVACDQFPLNPSKTPAPEKVVIIDHFQTEYVDAESPAEGVAATKVNVLSFHLKAENFEPVALEIYGRATLEGPPGDQEHSIHFRTDCLEFNPVETGYTFNTLQSIEAGSTYTLIRAKYPTNEYAPFEENQGRVKDMKFTEVWAFDAEGNSFAVEIGIH